MTLIPLWGILEEGSRYRLLLEHFLHLVLVVDLASRRNTNRQRRSLVHEHSIRYLEGLRDLFPHSTIPPNFHLVVHLARCLGDFGPPHSWWAYPFERINGLLQKIPTNHRFSECGVTDDACDLTSLNSRIRTHYHAGFLQSC